MVWVRWQNMDGSGGLGLWALISSALGMSQKQDLPSKSRPYLAWGIRIDRQRTS